MVKFMVKSCILNKCIENMHNIGIQWHWNYTEVKEFNYVLEIDFFRNSFQIYFGFDVWSCDWLQVRQTLFSTFFNPLMLTAAKTSLTILMKSFFLKHDWQNTWRRNADQNITNNFPSNI